MILGAEHGRGVVIELLPQSRVRMSCLCGSTFEARRDNVAAGRTRSCGCIAREQAIARAEAKAQRREHNRALKAQADLDAAFAMKDQHP